MSSLDNEEKEFYPSTFTSRPRELTVVEAVGKGRVTYRFLYTMRHNDANKMITFPPAPPHPLLYDKIDSFLKPALNTFILSNLIVGWGEGVIKEGAGICIKSIDLAAC